MLNIDALFLKLEEALKEKMPFVIFRYPNSDTINLWIQNSKELIQNSEFDAEGFVFAPFNLNDEVVIFPETASQKFEASLTEVRFEENFQTEKFQSDSNESKSYHISLVDSGIQFLNRSDCRKVVLSRKERVDVPNFDIIAAYKRMLQKYANACVYLWSHPEVGTWMGASPERLLKFENNEVETTSLAGTQVFGENLIWGEKEFEEQQIVTDYIVDVLEDYVNSIQTDGPKTSKAGTLAHLKSVITGKLKSSSGLKDIIEKLHPTPAVCGMPKKQSYDFLTANENYNRGFYTGFFGELSFNNPTNLYVNLRCLQYRNNSVFIYVGGGITAASNSENEWEETVEKANIMKAIL